MLRYYPASKVLPNQTTSGDEFVQQDGQNYKGKYYITYDGKFFSGPNPETGPSKPLKKKSQLASEYTVNSTNVAIVAREKEIGDFAKLKNSNYITRRIPGQPNSYFPVPTYEDYRKGYVIRYFTKRKNERGFIIEISQEEYNAIANGTADYDTRMYQVAKILWKVTGPLKSQRKSQYNIVPGIIDTNKRLVEAANNNFFGFVEFIGGEYDKFARPTA